MSNKTKEYYGIARDWYLAQPWPKQVIIAAFAAIFVAGIVGAIF